MDILSDVSINGGLRVNGGVSFDNGLCVEGGIRTPQILVECSSTAKTNLIFYYNDRVQIDYLGGFTSLFTEFIYNNISTSKTFNVFCQKVITIPGGCSKFNIGETYHEYPVVTAYDSSTGCKVEFDFYFDKTTKTLQASRTDTSACKQYIFSYMN